MTFGLQRDKTHCSSSGASTNCLSPVSSSICTSPSSLLVAMRSLSTREERAPKMHCKVRVEYLTVHSKVGCVLVVLVECAYVQKYVQECTRYSSFTSSTLKSLLDSAAASSESILMSKYVAESPNQTTDCRTFWPRRSSSTVYKHIAYYCIQLTKQFCTQLTKTYVAKTSCNQLLD